ncbi:hypothetical protein HYS30_00585, partial [Candidatus Peregrinibacteria bacterium]|nr:hypothetical protein [Candidatus Peregrinibacteria bacterium]
MLQKLREWLVLILIIGLPFHAFLVTVGTRLLVGPGYAPLPLLAGWKEMLLGVVLMVAVVEIALRMRQLSGASFQVPASPFRVDVADVCIVPLLILGIMLPGSWKLEAGSFLYGFKYTLFPLLLFIILRRVPWFTLSERSESNGSERFSLLVARCSLLVGVVVAGYGILTLFLPESFFTWLGYSDLHSTYLPDGPIAAFQKIEGTGIRRIQSTFSGPNQLGVWLLIPLSMAVVQWQSGFPSPVGRGLGRGGRGILYLVFLLLFLALFFTFSRAAWMGAAVIAITTFLVARSPFRVLPWRLLGCWVVGLLGLAAIGIMVFPTIFARGASSSEHWRRPMEAIRTIAAHPLGLGLGSAGPAQNRLSDSCVFLAKGADTSWAKDRPNLCVFSGGAQIQPFDRACRCPFLPENWYLQVGVELGAVGLLLFVILTIVLIRSLLRTTDYKLQTNQSFPTSYFLLPFVGVS